MTGTLVPGVEAGLDRAVEVLASAPRVALACHVNPDPDALGSMLGLAQALAARGAEVVCSWGNVPFEHPSWLEALGADGDVPIVAPDDFPADPDVMVALDTAAADRLGMLGANAVRAREMVVFDHHRTNPGFGTVVVLDPQASSTAELVFRALERLGTPLTPGIAACLYAGMVTDTGRFQYEATTPETLRVAAALREQPFDHARLARILFEDAPFASLRVAALALSRMVLLPEANLVWTYVTQSDLDATGAAMSDTDDLIDFVRATRETDVASVLKQQRDGRFKVSLRSKGDTNVGAVAQAFGGGGHRLAAGYTSDQGLEESVRQLVAALAGTSD